MGRVREQSPRQVLQADRRGTQAARIGNVEMGAHGRRDRPHSQTGSRGRQIMNWFQWRQAERDLDEEIREHIEIETRENIELGMPADQARYAAMKKFGNATRVKEQVHEMRIGLFFETVAQDAHYAIALLRRSPVST